MEKGGESFGAILQLISSMVALDGGKSTCVQSRLEFQDI